MSEDKPLYEAEENDENGLIMAGLKPVVQFEKPSEQIAEHEGRYEIIRSLGWIKFSTAFRDKTLAELKGAKLSIFISVCLHLNEDGESFPGIDTIAKETGYNRDTIMAAISEMENIPGLLQVIRERGKVNHYRPAFAAKGKKNDPLEPVGKIRPVESPVGKNTTGLTLTSLENPDSKKNKRRKKKGDLVDAVLFYGKQAEERGEDEVEDLIQQIERGLRVNITRSNSNQSAARRILKDGRPFSQWLTWCISDEWRAGHLYLYADLDRIWREYPQAFDTGAGMNPQGLSIS
jgi:hypothetical protein